MALVTTTTTDPQHLALFLRDGGGSNKDDNPPRVPSGAYALPAPRRHRKRARKRSHSGQKNHHRSTLLTAAAEGAKNAIEKTHCDESSPGTLLSTQTCFGLANATCVLCSADLPYEDATSRNQWVFLSCRGRAACRACVICRDRCPLCGDVDCDDERRVLERADAGCAESQFYVGQAYLLERADAHRAFRYLRLAAEQGHVEAAFKLALVYYESSSSSSSFEASLVSASSSSSSSSSPADARDARRERAREARRWYAVGADRGHVASQIFLDELDREFVCERPEPSSRISNVAAAC